MRGRIMRYKKPNQNEIDLNPREPLPESGTRAEVIPPLSISTLLEAAKRVCCSLELWFDISTTSETERSCLPSGLFYLLDLTNKNLSSPES